MEKLSANFAMARQLLTDSHMNARQRLIVGAVVEELDRALEALHALEHEPETTDGEPIEAYFQLVSDASIEGLVLHENGRILLVNDRMCEASGFRPEEVIGQSLIKFVPPDSVEALRAHVLSGSSDPYRAQALRKDGTSFPVEVTGRNFPHPERIIRLACFRLLPS